MDKDRIGGSFKQFSAGIRKAAGKLPGDEKANDGGKEREDGGEVPNTVGSTKDTVRAIESWANEGGAGGEVNR